jgi:hypothetical protein
VTIHLQAQTTEADLIDLQAAQQHGNCGNQQQPINLLRVAQAAAPQLEEPGFLNAEQLLAAQAEALGIAPDQIQPGIGITNQPFNSL